MASTARATTPISRDDIEAKLRQIRHEINTDVSAAKPIALTVAGVAAVAVVGVVYLLGRRRGRARSTVVEIRRI